VTYGIDTSFLLAVEIVEHAHHAEALRLLGELLARGDRVAIAPQVLTEFVHVVTDARRFQQPFSMETALNKSERWWNAAEADQVLPTNIANAAKSAFVRRGSSRDWDGRFDLPHHFSSLFRPPGC
jgi:predicted nucleic acid-binding protein